MKNKIILVVAFLASILGTNYLQREYFPVFEQVNVFDSTLVEQNKILENKIDSLNQVIAKGPDRVIVRVPVLQPAKLDTVYFETVVTDIQVDTIVKDSIIEIHRVEKMTYLESLTAQVESNDNYLAETIIIGDTVKGTKVKFRSNNMTENDVIYFSDAETLTIPLGYVTANMKVSRKIKFTYPAIHILLISSDKGLTERVDKIIKNRKKL